MHSLGFLVSPSASASTTVTTRRGALRSLLAPAAAGALAAAGLPAWANAYPARPLKTVISFPPAGATDILARLVAHKVGEKIGQSIMVENRPGAGGTLGLDAVARAPADGYSLYLAAVTNQMIAGHLYPTKADLQRDFVPVALIANAPHLLIVNNEVPAKTMAEFVAWLRSKSGTVNFASQGTGTLSHLESELLLQRTGTQAVHVPYKGSAMAVTDMLSGAVSFMFDSVAASLPLIQAGKVRALAVASSTAVPAVPNLPTVTQAGVSGYDVDNWFGIYAPKGTPQAAVDLLAKATAEVLKEKSTIDELIAKGYVVTPGDGAKLAALTQADHRRWGEVIKTAKVSL